LLAPGTLSGGGNPYPGLAVEKIFKIAVNFSFEVFITKAFSDPVLNISYPRG
jgi:hypothetical protein